MKKYRIKIGEGYNGCEPITVYWVQVRKVGFLSDSWENIKGFESKQKAEKLLNFLDN